LSFILASCKVIVFRSKRHTSEANWILNHS
jgi:hypothetical protein